MTPADRDQSTLGTSERPAIHSARVETRPVPSLTVVYHPNLNRIGARLFPGELVSGRALAISRHEPAFAPMDGGIATPLNDPFISRAPFYMEPLGDGLSIQRGTCRTKLSVDGSPVEETLDLNRDRLRRGVVLLLGNRVVLWLQWRPKPSDHPRARYGLIGESNALIAAICRLEAVADLDVPVLIRGESGTGKELFARAVHDASPRRKEAFLAVNMAAIPNDIAAAELFGTVDGAFTGARARPGYFRQASGGTLFMDEIGETPSAVQPLLLRALENGEVMAVGGSAPTRVRTRLIAATDTDLDKAVLNGDFRGPLLHRLSGFVIRLPPLRDRREDLGLLFKFFLEKEAQRVGRAHRLHQHDERAEPWAPAELVANLFTFDWPGNVRQLSNFVRQLVIAGRNAEQLPATEWTHFQQDALCWDVDIDLETQPTAKLSENSRKPGDVTEEELREALAAERYELSAAAARLAMPRTSLYALIRRTHGLQLASDLTTDSIREAFFDTNGHLDAMVDRLQVSKTALSRRIRDLGLQRSEENES